MTVLVAYPLLSLDQIGIELENPFSANRLSHLPLNDIGDTIERNVLALESVPENQDENSPPRRAETPFQSNHTAERHPVS